MFPAWHGVLDNLADMRQDLGLQSPVTRLVTVEVGLSTGCACWVIMLFKINGYGVRFVLVGCDDDPGADETVLDGAAESRLLDLAAVGPEACLNPGASSFGICRA